MRVLATDNRVRVASPAKINLALEVLGKRADGFHELETVIATVSLFDELLVQRTQETESTLELRWSVGPEDSVERDPIPTDQRNLVLRAFARIRAAALEEFPQAALPGLRATLTKVIPSAAGLGGASSNAAAALLAANHLWGLHWSPARLRDLAAELGSDVPCFLFGGLTHCQGRGEIVQPLSAPAGIDVVIAKPPVGLSTAAVFAQVKAVERPVGTRQMLTALKHGDRHQVANCLTNSLRHSADQITPAIVQLQRAFEQLNCHGHQMSGSGSSYFGIFANRKTACRAAARLSARHPQWRVFAARTLAPDLSNAHSAA